VKLPSAALLVKVAVGLTVFGVLVIAALVVWLSGSIVAAVIVAVVLLVLGIPPIFVAQHLIERAGRQRRARNFRMRTGHSGPRTLPGGDRESVT
jgi:uncharacterized protein (DUF2062 family)